MWWAEKSPRGKLLREYQGIEAASIYDRTQRRGYEAAKALYVLFTILGSFSVALLVFRSCLAFAHLLPFFALFAVQSVLCSSGTKTRKSRLHFHSALGEHAGRP